MEKDEEFVKSSRQTFSYVRVLSVIAGLCLPVTFFYGSPAPLWVFLSAPVFAAGWLVCLLMSWRRQNMLWAMAAAGVLLVLPRFTGIPDLATAQSLQWLCLLVLLGGLPLLLFPKRVLRWARLEDGEESGSSKGP